MKQTVSICHGIEFYLQTRRQLGFALRQEGVALQGLGRYARAIDHRGPLTTKLVLAWAQLPAAANRLWWARRLEMARRFALFWVAYDPATQLPPAGVFGPAYRRRPVHIYRREEMRALLRAAAALEPVHGWPPHLFKTLLGLLACTGLRISEALQLQDGDLDWERGTLTVRQAKFGQCRCLPLHASTLRALRSYQAQRRATRCCGPAFFGLPTGEVLTYGRAAQTFRQLCNGLGWTKAPMPRLHDLRHSFAVGCLLRWYGQGTAAGQRIVALSAYLGHRQISSTYWYLTAVPELLILANRRWEAAQAQPQGGPDA